MTERGVRRLLALVLALAFASVIPTIAAGLAAHPGEVPSWWSTTVVAACALLLLLLTAQAVSGRDWLVPVFGVVLVGDAALASYPLVASGAQPDAPWVLALSPVSVGAGAVLLRSRGAMLLALLHLGFRLELQLSGVWTVPSVTALLDAMLLLVVASAASVCVQAVRTSAAQLGVARAEAEREAAAAGVARAVELENTRWDAIVHDDVLATLTMTAHARTSADRVRARTAARTALASVERDVAPDPVSLSSLLEQLRAGVQGAHPQVRLELPRSQSPAHLDPDVADTVLAAVVETVRNAVRHGARAGDGPPDVRVRIRVDDGRFTVEVRDDGVGFDLTRPARSLGLVVSVRRRAQAVGGAAYVRSVPGVGTVVLLTFPLRVTDLESDRSPVASR
ncbi:MAG: sensor histidine kinase [Janthinobacterium lividum]